MRKSGQIVLFPFPQTNQIKKKLRPALLLKQVPGQFDDWLLCMISSQLHQEIKNYDEVMKKDDSDFPMSGLKTDSLIRIGRLAVVEADMIIGSIGEISSERLKRICTKLSEWIKL